MKKSNIVWKITFIDELMGKQSLLQVNTTEKTTNKPDDKGETICIYF